MTTSSDSRRAQANAAPHRVEGPPRDHPAWFQRILWRWILAARLPRRPLVMKE